MSSAPELKGRFVDPGILQGPLLPIIFKLTWPVAAAFLLQSAYGIVDTFWLARWGATLNPDVGYVPVSAVIITGLATFALLAWMQIFSSGVVTLVARAWGAKNYDAGRGSVRQTLLLTIVSSLPPSVLVYLLADQIMVLLGASGPVVDQGAIYLRVIALGLPPWMLSMAAIFALRGTGDMISPMKIMAPATLINVVLDPFLIYGWWFFPRMGIAGAALATIIAQYFSAVIGIYLLAGKNSPIDIGWRGIIPRPDPVMMKDIIIIGLPGGLQFMLNSASIILLMGYAARFGNDPDYAMKVIAALGIAVPKLIQTFTMVVVSISFATTTIVGQSLGANKIPRAWKSTFVSLYAALVIQFLGVLTFCAFPVFFMKIFTPDPELIRISVPIMRISSLILPFLGVSIILGGAFRGAGNTFPVMSASIIRLASLYTLLLILPVRLGMGWNGIWWSMLGMNIVEAIFTGVWFSFGHWTRMRFKSVDVDIPLIE